MRRGVARLLATALCLALAACGSGASTASEDGSDVTRAPAGEGRSEGGMTVAEREEFAAVRVPTSATGVEISSVTGIDTSVAARFAVPAADLDGFAEDAGLAEPLEPGERSLQVGVGEDLGWDIDAIEELAGQDDRVDGVVRGILVASTTSTVRSSTLHAFST